MFSLTYKYKETTYTIFSTPSNPTHPVISNYYNVQPLLIFRTREYVKTDYFQKIKYDWNQYTNQVKTSYFLLYGLTHFMPLLSFYTS